MQNALSHRATRGSLPDLKAGSNLEASQPVEPQQAWLKDSTGTFLAGEELDKK
jgi:hypothetical protein